jgi:hypothetical protein
LREKVLAIGRRQRRQRRLKRALRLTELVGGGLAMCVALGVLGWHGYTTLYASSIDNEVLPAMSAPPSFVKQIVEAKTPSIAPLAQRPAEQPAAKTIERDVTFNLPNFGDLIIDGVTVETQRQGEFKRTLLSGRHRVRAENPFRIAVEKTIDVPAEGDVPEVRLPFEGWKPAMLLVKGATPGTQAVIDGNPRGTVSDTTPFSIPMTQGSRTVKVHLLVSGQPDVFEQVKVGAGQTVGFNVK